MKKLRLAILGKNGKNLDDLSHMDGKCCNKLKVLLTLLGYSEFVHTSDLESLSSLVLKYSSKTYVYR